MDLYIQIGVLLLFLTALALFIYVYTGPAQQFTQEINTTNQTINDRLVTSEGLDVAPFMNNVSIPGTSVYPLIRDARAGKIAILVQTKNSQGLVVNYGYQLRGANYKLTEMIPNGFSGVGGAAPAGGVNRGTDFEKNFVTSVKETFADVSAAGASKVVPFGQTAFTGKSGADLVKTLKGLDSNNYPPASAITANASDGVSEGSGQFASTPKIAFSDPTVTVDEASQKGRTFSSTGLLYTDNVLKLDAPVNDNFSYADNQGSLYRFNQNSTYYSTIIVNANGDIVGVYIEEHGVNPAGAVLATMMLDNGTITQLY